MCDGGRKEFRATLGKMLRSSIDPNVQVQVQANMTNPMARDRSQGTSMQLLVDNKQGSQGHSSYNNRARMPLLRTPDGFYFIA